MEIRSTTFRNNDELPRDYTCQGSGSPPPLEWGQVPENAKSLVLICDDPDAPKGTFYHWGVYNIPPETGKFPADPSLKDFPQARNTSGKTKYHPPCPPAGDGPHNYRFHVWALDVEELEFDATPTVEELMEKAESHVVERGILQARFEQ